MLFFVIADARKEPELRHYRHQARRLGKEALKVYFTSAEASTATGRDSKTAAETGQRKARAADAAKP